MLTSVDAGQSIVDILEACESDFATEFVKEEALEPDVVASDSPCTFSH